MAADIGFMALASINDGASNAQLDIPGAVMITLPEAEVGEIERTQLVETNPTKKYRPTLIDEGSLKVEVNFTSAVYARFRTLLRARVLKTMILTGPDEDAGGAGTPERFEYDGFVKKLSPGSYEREGGRVFSFEFRVNDSRFVAAGAPNT